jgi:hypothetical protein
MKFTYIGGTEFDGTEMPAKVTCFGVTFIIGGEAEVENPFSIQKLMSNKYFEAVDDAAKATKQKGKKVRQESNPVMSEEV